MPSPDPGELPADLVALTGALARGEVSAVEVVTQQLRRLRSVHDATNCVAAWNDDAPAAAARLDRDRARHGPVGRMHGVPFTVKDWIDVAGLPCTGGFVECRDRVPSHDASVVARLRDEGAIVLAKTTVQVDSDLFGLVLHPLDPARTPGGSSSGEAAAVGGGGSLVGIGSDSGGSIRLPAAWCGAAGLKPSAGRVPTTGHFPRVGDRADGRTQIGPIASSVRDLVAVLDVIAGPDNRDAAVAPVALGDVTTVDITSLRVGYSLGDDPWAPTPVVRAAVEGSVARLAALGATIAGAVPQDLDAALDITRRYWKRARGVSDNAEIEGQLRDWDRYRTKMLQATRDVDVVVMPATAGVAPEHRPTAETDYVYLLPASLTGAPAVVVPVTFAASLPVAVQVVARPWDDHVALAVAAMLERSDRAG